MVKNLVQAKGKVLVTSGCTDYAHKGMKTRTKLHPCIETLNSRNLGFAKDSFKVSFGFRILWRPRLIKDPQSVKNHVFYCVFAQK